MNKVTVVVKDHEENESLVIAQLNNNSFITQYLWLFNLSRKLVQILAASAAFCLISFLVLFFQCYR